MNFTDEDALRLARLLKSADGGCGHCGRALLSRMAVLDPSRDWDSYNVDNVSFEETPDGEAERKLYGWDEE